MASLAKLTRPRLHDVVHRERLFSQLDAARDRCKVIWVSGPPGCGKTTLVASYQEANTPASGVWYQVDAGDNDISTFFHYLSQTIEGSKGRRRPPLPLLTPEYLADIPGYTRLFFREFFSRLKLPAILTLDNYHELSADSAFHDVLEQALAEIPDGLSVVVISREVPPADWAHLDAAKRLARVDWDDLRLTLDEARAIASGRLAVADETLRPLYQMSGGWAAGWMLTLERVKRLGSQPEHQQGEALEAIFNYFSGQIFEASPLETREFLMRTALFPRITVPIAEQLSGNPHAAELLDHLYRRGLFIDRRGARPYSYQYHDLLRAFLLAQLQTIRTPAELVDLRRRAGHLLEEAGLIDDAIYLYRDAQDWDSAARMILANAERLLGQGRGMTLRDWIDALPKGMVDRTPWLTYWMGISLLPIAPAAARASLESAFDTFGRTQDVLGQLLAGAGVIHTFRFEFERFEPVDPWIETVDRLLRQDPPFLTPTMELHVNGALVFALGYRRPDPALLLPRVSRMEDLLTTASIAADDIAAAARILIQHYMIAFEFANGRRLIDHVRPLLEGSELSPVNKALWLTGQGFHHWWEGDIDRADTAFSTSLGICEANGIVLPATKLYNFFGLSVIAVDRADHASAESYRIQAVRYADPTRRNDRFHDVIVKAKIATFRGNWLTAIELSEQALRVALEVGWQLLVRDAYIACALPLIEVGRFDEAATHLRNAREIAQGFGGHRSTTDIALLEGYSSLRQGDVRVWHERVAWVIGQLQSTEDRLCLRESPTVMRLLLAAALDADIESEYVCRLIRRYNVRPLLPSSQNWPWPIRIRTLGQFKVLVDGMPLEFSRKVPKKPLQMLKALVAFGATDVSEQKIADALWPDEHGDTARNSCATTVLRLRRLLGDPAAVVQVGGHLSLNPDRVWIDATAFATDCRNVRIDDATFDEADVGRAITHYLGNFLPDDTHESWTVSLREKLRSNFIVCVSGLARRYQRDERLEAAMDLYRRGIEADELAEVFYHGLMRCHQRRDERPEALSVYRRLKHTLSATLGIQPAVATQALAQALRGSETVAPDGVPRAQRDSSL